MLRKGAKPMFLFNTGMKFRHSSNSMQQAQNNAGHAPTACAYHKLALARKAARL